MITDREIALVENHDNYQIIRITNDYIEFRSRNTWHCWKIAFDEVSERYPYSIYHKLKLTHNYHKHWQSYSFVKCFQSIKDHDDYVMRVTPVFQRYISCSKNKSYEYC